VERIQEPNGQSEICENRGGRCAMRLSFSSCAPGSWDAKGCAPDARGCPRLPVAHAHVSLHHSLHSQRTQPPLTRRRKKEQVSGVQTAAVTPNSPFVGSFAALRWPSGETMKHVCTTMPCAPIHCRACDHTAVHPRHHPPLSLGVASCTTHLS
jgi:hypothetical protein